MGVQLSTPLSKVLKSTKDHIGALESMGMQTVEDFILYLPRAHEDLSQTHTLLSAPLNEKVTLRGTVERVKMHRTRTRKTIVRGIFTDADGDNAEVIWFNQPHIVRMLKDGDEVVLTGKVVENGNKLQLQSPVFEKQHDRELVHSGKLVPIYPQHDIINTRWIREKMSLVRDCISQIPETLPSDVLKDEGLISRANALEYLHFPESPEDVEQAQQRLLFEQMYNLQKEALERKADFQSATQDRLKIEMNVDLIKEFFASLKFTPTESQRIAIYEILRDMERETPMSRLLEGDVGSGKTLVATAVIANTIQAGGQCALMVPTEVLAKQHCESIGKTLIHFSKSTKGDAQLPVVALLTGSTPKKQADDIKLGLSTGTIDLVIGTHSLIEDPVVFKNLTLVIVDEQHRFGVMQRKRLQEKGSPHFLSMTATPIPRTLALTAYGHHDLSVLLEKPGNRQPIDTKVVSPRDRKTVELFIDTQIQEGRQAFVICPLIKESTNDEMADMKNVQQETERLKEGFPNRRIASLHGKMTPSEKEEIMQQFKDKSFDILVSTSVIEVGIDVPNSTIIIIEGSERFGLAQLHQFRGRVGRGEHKSYCFLFTTHPEQARSQRLKAMEKYTDGFQLAEIDLQLRGPGELYGTRQSGIPGIDVKQLFNPELVVRARRAAEKSIQNSVSRVLNSSVF